jgi:signal transduction histidine kinase
VIGAAALATGLLLVLTGLMAARIPGGATFARPGIAAVPGESDDATGGIFAFARRAPNPIQAFLLSPIHPATWAANAAILAGMIVATGGFAIVLTALTGGVTTLLAGVGFAFVAFGIEASRVVARIERRRVFAGERSRPPAHAYRPLRGGIVEVIRAEFADESRWRDVLYVALNFPLAVFEFIVVAVAWLSALSIATTPIWYDAMADATLPGFLTPLAGHDMTVVIFRCLVGLALLPVAASMSQLVIGLHRGVVAGLLCTSESRELRRQLEAVRKSRSAVLDVEATGLHRIERDLHDGAQQRLVMMTIDLGLASERVETDPAAAKQLILEGQEQARQALAEIRQLVRGIAPSILLDRGLVPAVESILGHGPIATGLVSNLAVDERLSPATERAAYFVVSEALANVAKHSGASRGEVRLRRENDRLIVEVWDDGRGGANAAPGGGLAGLADRVAGVDGAFSVSSPTGGPTLVRAEIPVAAVETGGGPAPESGQPPR